MEPGEQTGTWVRQVDRAMEAQFRDDQQDLKNEGTEEESRGAKRIRGIAHEDDRNKGSSHVQDEMRKLMHHDEQDLLSLWEGCHWDDIKKAGGLIQNCAPKRTCRRGVHSSPQDVHESLQRGVLTRDGEAPILTGWAETDKENQRSPMCARGGSRRNTRRTRTRGQSCTRRHRR